MEADSSKRGPRYAINTKVGVEKVDEVLSAQGVLETMVMGMH